MQSRTAARARAFFPDLRGIELSDAVRHGKHGAHAVAWRRNEADGQEEEPGIDRVDSTAGRALKAPIRSRPGVVVFHDTAHETKAGI
ncbi:MAG: hypothetical protein CME06_13895 [Gemmatimonadetes bacterium]|nr:hypothetical protein [Gemmatimonadota bacterium]